MTRLATDGWRRASWRGWLLLAIVAGILLSLSAWQLQRARTKLAMQHLAQARALLPQLDLRAAEALAMSDPAQLAERQVRLRGHYLPGYRVALDNQMRGSRAGYDLHQVFQPEHGGPAWLVDRGWLPTDRDGGPAVPAEDSGERDAQVMLTGRMVFPADYFTTGPAEFTRGLWRTGRIDTREWSQRWRISLQPWVLRLDPAAPGGYRRDWPAHGGSEFGPERHRAYAIQWLLLALAWMACWTYFHSSLAGRHE